MKVEIWSDVVCPWCYIGKRRFEAALARFPHRDQVEVVWRSFELDPHAESVRAAGEGPDHADVLASKYGMSRAQAEAAIDNVTAGRRGRGPRLPPRRVAALEHLRRAPGDPPGGRRAGSRAPSRSA